MLGKKVSQDIVIGFETARSPRRANVFVAQTALFLVFKDDFI